MTQYSDPKYGVEQVAFTDLTGSLASTVAATELFRYRVKKAQTLSAVYARLKVGGTDAVRKIIIGTCAAGGSCTAIGTSTLGTQANNTTKDLGISGVVAAGEEIVFQHLGTGAEPWNLQFELFMSEKFVQA
jgi:hypothetical protein